MHFSHLFLWSIFPPLPPPARSPCAAARSCLNPRFYQCFKSCPPAALRCASQPSTTADALRDQFSLFSSLFFSRLVQPFLPPCCFCGAIFFFFLPAPSCSSSLFACLFHSWLSFHIFLSIFDTLQWAEVRSFLSLPNEAIESGRFWRDAIPDRAGLVHGVTALIRVPSQCAHCCTLRALTCCVAHAGIGSRSDSHCVYPAVPSLRRHRHDARRFRPLSTAAQPPHRTAPPPFHLHSSWVLMVLTRPSDRHRTSPHCKT